MPRLPRRHRAAALATAATAVVAAAALIATNAYAGDGIKWTVTKVPAIDGKYSFNSADGIADEDMWAVGYTVDQSWNGTVAAHWDGKEWKRADTPKGDAFTAVSYVKNDDAWAVGAGASGAMTARWDGKKWRDVPTPKPDVPSGQTAVLNGVDNTKTGAWAVGCASSEDQTAQTAFAQRWDGEWKLAELPVPKGAKNTCLNDVLVTASGEAWAVGRFDDGKRGSAYILHWQDGTWSLVDAPALDAPDVDLTGVAVSGDRVYAAGFTKKSFGDPMSATPLLLASDGGKWGQVKGPDTTAWIYGLGADGDNGVLLTGYTQDGKGVVLRSDGTTVTSETGPVTDSSSLLAVALAPGSSTAWVLGSRGEGDSALQGLAAHTD